MQRWLRNAIKASKNSFPTQNVICPKTCFRLSIYTPTLNSSSRVNLTDSNKGLRAWLANKSDHAHGTWIQITYKEGRRSKQGIKVAQVIEVLFIFVTVVTLTYHHKYMVSWDEPPKYNCKWRALVNCFGQWWQEERPALSCDDKCHECYLARARQKAYYDVTNESFATWVVYSSLRIPCVIHVW